MNQIKLFIKTVLGFCMYHTLPKKKIILILSSMRSGSTLLKALLGQANDVSHLSEYNFQNNHNKYHSYFDVYRLSSEAIIILKQPSFYNNFNAYPILPKYQHSKIILLRNPKDTINSILNMHELLKEDYSIHFVQKYWTETYKNLFKFIDDKNAFVVDYNDLITSPKSITKNLFDFIGAKINNGVSEYNPPKTGWEWKKDDGSHNIKQLKVLKSTNPKINIKLNNVYFEEMKKVYNSFKINF
jgi:hypothetical protein